MSRRHRTTSINHVEIPPQVRRDVILEHDAVYIENNLALTRRMASGKIAPEQFRSTQQWLQEAAMRRAHISRSESAVLLSA